MLQETENGRPEEQSAAASSTEGTSKSIIRGTAVVGVLTVFSRILGFFRDLVIARVFGAGMIADAFFVAFRIPNLLRSFVAEGAFTSAFVPIFSSELGKSRQHGQEMLSRVCALLLIVTAALSVIGIVYAPTITAVFAPGFGEGTEKTKLCVSLMRVMLPYVVAISVVAMINGALNTVKIFGMAAFGQIVMNFVLIVGTLIAGVFNHLAAAYILSVSVIVGGIVQIFALKPSLKKAGFALTPRLGFLSPVIRELLVLMLPATIGAGAYQIAIFLNTLFASFLVEGSVSWLFYADRLAQVPIGIFTVALASVLLPTLSNLEAGQDHRGFGENLINSLRYTSFLIIPIAFGLYYFAQPLVIILFERGAFTRYSSINTALALQALCVGLWVISCHSMMVRAFLAKKDTVSPTVVGIAALLVNAGLSLFFMGAPRPGQSGAAYHLILALQQQLFPMSLSPQLAHAGLALASSFSSAFSFAALALLFARKSAAINWGPFVRTSIKALLAGCGMNLALSLFVPSIPGPILQVAAGVPAGVIVFYALCWLMRMRELQEVTALIKRKLPRKTAR